ncbi:hypothetical protein [Erythrobacter sp. F6033]|nr:hypothetical protein [Erythrobacter sp. F6033]
MRRKPSDARQFLVTLKCVWIKARENSQPIALALELGRGLSALGPKGKF